MAQSTWHPPDRAWSASGALFHDDRGRVLLVEPVYKPTWEIPGGIVEPGESPRETCRREVLEELGLEIEPGRLLVVDYARPPFAHWEGLRFVFDGGILDQRSVEGIRLQEEELASWRFVDEAALADLVAPPLRRRIGVALQTGTQALGTRYLEYGIPAD